MTTIPIEVDDATARAFRDAPAADRERLARMVQSYLADRALSGEERVERFVRAADALGASAQAAGWNAALDDALLRGELDDDPGDDEA